MLGCIDVVCYVVVDIGNVFQSWSGDTVWSSKKETQTPCQIFDVCMYALLCKCCLVTLKVMKILFDWLWGSGSGGGPAV